MKAWEHPLGLGPHHRVTTGMCGFVCVWGVISIVRPASCRAGRHTHVGARNMVAFVFFVSPYGARQVDCRSRFAAHAVAAERSCGADSRQHLTTSARHADSAGLGRFEPTCSREPRGRRRARGRAPGGSLLRLVLERRRLLALCGRERLPPALLRPAQSSREGLERPRARLARPARASRSRASRLAPTIGRALRARGACVQR